MQGGWVYILTNKPSGILYTGVTADLSRRVCQHREAGTPGFTRRCGLKRLVWCEHHETIASAMEREETIKRWPRAWTIQLILSNNPDWHDLYERLKR